MISNYLPTSKPFIYPSFLAWWIKETFITSGKMRMSSKSYFPKKPLRCRLLTHWLTISLHCHWNDLKREVFHITISHLRANLENGWGAIRRSRRESIIAAVHENIFISVLAQLLLCIWQVNTPLWLLIHNNIYLWEKVVVEFNLVESGSYTSEWSVLDKYKYKHDYFCYPWFKLLTSKGHWWGRGS